jgi:hypothetical protein
MWSGEISPGYHITSMNSVEGKVCVSCHEISPCQMICGSRMICDGHVRNDVGVVNAFKAPRHFEHSSRNVLIYFIREEWRNLIRVPHNVNE